MRRLGTQIRAGGLALTVLLGVGWMSIRSDAGAAELSAGSRIGQHWLTLVTGDQVLLQVSGTDTRVVTVRASKGREDVKFLRQVDRGDTYVIPVDAARLVAADRVDRRLFDVTKLAKLGYDDQARGDVPVIVGYAAGTVRAAAQSRVGAGGGRVSRALHSLNADAVDVRKADTTRFWATMTGAGTAPRALTAGVSKLWLDGRVTASLDQSVPQIGAPQAWQAGYTGKGTTVAVLDTGIDVDHPDLADAVVAAQDFTGSASGTADLFGHGTHVAGIITGNGSASGGRYVGVAPDAKLVNGKVLDDRGGGFDSDIIAGMEWAVAQGAEVVNMSLGSDFPDDGSAPLSQAVDRLTVSSGTLFVVAAGNSGPDDQSVGSPGSADEALTVGAVDKQDALADFSSRGPRWANLAIKPDITAPGVDIVSALAPGSYIADNFPAVDGQYVSLSGTSMAAPHVAGAAAILAGEHPDWTADRLKAALMDSAAPRAGLSVYQQGAGRVDVGRAATQQVTATPASLSEGIVAWPHTDDQPISNSVTYHNDGTAPVTLTLTTDVRDPRGNAAPAGMFTVSPTQLTVPAHGTGTARLVTDTAVTAPDGTYGGLLTATDGQTVVRTPVGVTREVESYNMDLTILDRTGQPTSDYFVRLVNLDVQQAVVPYDESGRVVTRIAKGRYYLEAIIQTPGDGPGSVSIVVEPQLVVDGDTGLVLDARSASPVGFDLDQPGAQAASGELDFAETAAWGPTGMYISGSLDGEFVRPSSTSAPSGQFTFTAAEEAARPDGSGGFAGSPYLYHLRRSVDGRVPTELAVRVPDRELVTVQTRIASSAPDEIASKELLVDLPTPATLTEHYTPGVSWYPAVYLRHQGSDPFDFDTVLGCAPVTYRLGRTVVQRWNVGVFGPAFPDDPNFGVFGGRRADEISAFIPLFSDQPANHWGISTDSASMTLALDGRQIGASPYDSGDFTVPAAPGTYRLASTATRTVATMSTQVSAAWTFRSGTEPADTTTPLPMMAVRFDPQLDEYNRAPAGVPFALPVYVQRQAGASYGSLTSLRVQVSYDDGKRWLPVGLAGAGLRRVALLLHPAGGGYVSLKATAVDSAGNTVEETIIRAYALKG